MYRMEHGVTSLLLDDDNCDCKTSLNLGHGMCLAGHSTSYGPENRFGVDLLYDPGCQAPTPDNGLTLFFKGLWEINATLTHLCNILQVIKLQN